MRRDLLDLITSERDISSMFVLTHNIDFLFVETLVLSAIRRCGNPALTVFADAECAAQSYSTQRTFITWLGQRYRVAPVQMAPGFRFHPKAVLLSGSKSATLLVGSGNLTFGGWQNNAELWCRFSSEDGLPQLAAFRAYLEQVLERVPLNEAIRAEWADAFDVAKHGWAGTLPAAGGLLARCGAGRAFNDAFDEQLGNRRVDEITIVSPYFDPGGDAAAEIAMKATDGRARLLVPAERSNLTASAFGSLPHGVHVAATIGAKRKDSAARPFVHAKAIAFRTGEDVLLFSGSANCSRAALLCDGALGNAELTATQSLTNEEFESQILSEVEIVPGPPALVFPADATVGPEGTTQPRITAARLVRGVMRIAFSGFAEAETLAGLIDGNTIPVRRLSPNIGELEAPMGRRAVRLQAERQGVAVQTEPFWVDDEESLAVSAPHRSFESVLARRLGSKTLEQSQWQEMAKALCAYLDYVPSATVGPPPPRETKQTGHRFTTPDAFPEKIVWKPGAQSPRAPGDKAVPNLDSLISAWFLRAEGDDISTKAAADASSDGDEAVDRPISPLEGGVTVSQSPQDLKPSVPRSDDRHKKRAALTLRQIVNALTSTSYTDYRHPADMARDIKAATMLFRLASATGWLDLVEIVEATSQTWRALFVADEGGAVGKRLQNDPVATKQYLGAPDVSAALLGWALEVPSTPSTAHEVEASIVMAMAVAWHPWLFGVTDVEALGPHVALLLRATPQTAWPEEPEKRWEKLVALGRALARLEACLAEQKMLEWNRRRTGRKLAREN